MCVLNVSRGMIDRQSRNVRRIVTDFINLIF